jgi:hypothetical protein
VAALQYSTGWQLDAQNRVTLYELMTDYLRHLEAHLDQITDTLAAVNER